MIGDLRQLADEIDTRPPGGVFLNGVCESLRGAAGEIERLYSELLWLRDFADEHLTSPLSEPVEP